MQALLRDVAQSGLEYSSGGRVVAGSNPVIPTTNTKKRVKMRSYPFFVAAASPNSEMDSLPEGVKQPKKNHLNYKDGFFVTRRATYCYFLYFEKSVFSMLPVSCKAW